MSNTPQTTISQDSGVNHLISEAAWQPDRKLSAADSYSPVPRRFSEKHKFVALIRFQPDIEAKPG
jgi:hypothetical protein